MKIDLHCHSKYSQDTFLEPEAIIEEAIRVGLDGVCFTEHYSYAASEPVERIRAREGFLVLRGVEISTGSGHLLVYGIGDDSWPVPSKGRRLDTRAVIDYIQDSGGICVPAHPFRGWESFGLDLLKYGGIDALETHNGASSEMENEKATLFAGRINCPGVGGSDCHERYQVGRAYTVFANPVFSLACVITEIRKGNCRGEIWPGNGRPE